MSGRRQLMNADPADSLEQSMNSVMWSFADDWNLTAFNVQLAMNMYTCGVNSVTNALIYFQAMVYVTIGSHCSRATSLAPSHVQG